MDKLNFKTANGIDVNLEKLSQLFPEAITETKDENGNIKRVANLDVLKTLLNGYVADPNDVECYEFTWLGKREAIMEAAKSTTKTLRPCPEESKNWDSTQNLYIEGDNLEVLKLLQESYLGKVKMIYIDPPYNTGKDFVYRDNFHKSAKDAKEDETARDEETDDNLFQNTESNGRFHSDWCSMIYSRLKLARDLLSDDGVIFISIDDNEVHNLRKICDEIFGEENFVTSFIVTSAPAGTQSAVNVSVQHSYCLCYAKRSQKLKFLVKRTAEELTNRYSESYPKGNFYSERLWKRGVGGRKEDVPSLHFPIYFNPETDQILVDNEYQQEKGFVKIIPYHTEGILGRWTWSRETMIQKRDNLFVKKVAGEWKLHKKVYESEETGKLPFSIIGADIGRTEIGGLEVKNIFDYKKIFDYPKSVSLISHFIKMGNLSQNSIILDFFSGSATTAHACMQLNAEDGGNRKFIMVQLPEVCAPESEAAKAGYKNICEIGKERIRRAGEKIKAEHATTAPNLDIGFRVLKLDESNMKEVYYKPDELSQNMLSGLESNIKEDRNDLDLLYACLIDWGVELALPLKTEEINGVKVYTVNDSEIPDLIACFSENIPETTIREIAKRKPLRVVFRDSSFADSPSKINVTEIFKTFSPNTTIKVL